jgi:cysteine desulfurase
VRYFDHNATSPLSATARAAWLEAVERFPANPSSPHRLGARADAALTEARQAAADWLGCSPFDLVWTGGATEANNAVFHHAAQTASGEVWVSAIEHPCVLAAARRWLEGRVRLIPVTPAGVVNVDWLDDALSRQRPALVALMAANNETGVLQPWREALAMCRRHGVPFACDAAQWLGKLPAAGLGECDFVTGCAHKFGGPPGVGFMKVPSGFRPLIVGGPQEDGRRAGTENLPGVLAMTAGWAERERQLAAGEANIRETWRDQFIAELRAALPEIEVLGERIPRLWNTVAALMPPTNDCRRRWVVQLDKLGFAVSTGSACASGKEQPSHVLLAMGCDPAKSDRMLRFSAGWDTTHADWQALREAVVAGAARMKILASA